MSDSVCVPFVFRLCSVCVPVQSDGQEDKFDSGGFVFKVVFVSVCVGLCRFVRFRSQVTTAG